MTVRIDGWHIEGFGVFADAAVRHLPPGLTVVSGPNEAGKSTLLAFVRGVLFGFPDGTDGTRTHPPVHGGRHGGRLTLVDDDGRWVIERFAAPPRLTVRRPDGRMGTADDLRRLLGGADATLFANVFAFSLTELDSFDVIGADAVRDRVLSAGITGAGRSARRALAEIDDRRTALLGPPRSAVPAALVDVREARIAVERARARSRDARARRAQLVELDRAADDARRAADEAQAELHALEALLAAWPTWARLLDAEEQTQARATEPVADATVATELARLDGEIAAASHERDRVRALADARADRAFAAGPTGAGPGPTPAALVAADRSLPVSAAAREAAGRAAELEQAVDDAVREVADAAQRRELADRDGQRARVELRAAGEPASPIELDLDAERLARAREVLVELAALRGRRDAQASRVGSAPAPGPHRLAVPGGAVAAVGLAGGAALAAAVGAGPVAGGLVVAAAAAGAWSWSAGRARSRGRAEDDARAEEVAELAELGGRIAALEAELASLGGALGIPTRPAPADLDARADALAAARRAHAAATRAQDDLDRATTQYRGADDAHAAAERSLAHLRDRLLAESGALTAQVDRDLAALESRLARAEAEREALLATIGVADAAGLERAVAAGRSRHALEVERAAAEAELAALVGRGPAAEDLLARIVSGDRAAWEADAAACRARLAELATSHEDRIRRHHDAQREVAGDDASTAVADAALGLEAARARLREAVDGWQTWSATAALVAAALARHERERQPAVLARAEHLFGLVTDGHYRKIIARDDELVLIDDAGRTLTAGDLSRGTVELLYLCVRFGLAVELAAQTALPIVMDDVFVNFDPQRMHALADVISGLAEEHQILLFTCQPATVSVLRSARPDLRRIDLPRFGAR